MDRLTRRKFFKLLGLGVIASAIWPQGSAKAAQTPEKAVRILSPTGLRRRTCSESIPKGEIWFLDTHTLHLKLHKENEWRDKKSKS